MKTLSKIIFSSIIITFMVYLSACNKNEGMTYDTPDVKLATDATLGSLLVDANGYTLYFFTRDTKGSSVCSGGCLNAWPVFYAADLKIDSGLDMDDFGEITRSDGAKQTTYKGWPLYYYSPTGDGVLEDPGATEGEGANGVWYVAKPNYTLMIADAQLVGHDGKNYTSDYEEGEETTKYFVDEYGNTLYIFINDEKDTNNFTASDFSNNGTWPIFYMEIEDLPSDMNEADFGEITVFGEKQLTFKGWPLYYFGQDANRGDNKGISFPSPGVWPIVNNSTGSAPL